MRILQILLMLATILAYSHAVIAQSPTSPTPQITEGLGALSNFIAQQSTIAATNPVTSITISAIQNSVTAGAPVRLKVTLTNISDHDLALAVDTRGMEYRFDVRDSQGKLAPDTDVGYFSNGNVAHPDLSRLSLTELEGNMVYGTLKVGQTYTRELDASKFYVMSVPGKYTIKVHRADVENLSLNVTSNTITVTVTPLAGVAP